MLTTMILIMLSWWEPVQVLEGLSGIWLRVEHSSQQWWVICRLLLTREHFESVLCCEGGMDASYYSVFLSFFKIHVRVSHQTILHTWAIGNKKKISNRVLNYAVCPNLSSRPGLIIRWPESVRAPLIQQQLMPPFEKSSQVSAGL